ncbi:hypothetical protein CRUP_016247, partial [Coryphaenoides rupestris]
MSFPLDSSDRGLVHFHQSDIHNTTTLLLSNDNSTLYVGAQNAILSLDVSKPDVIILKIKMDWSPSKEDTKTCSSKLKNATVDCPNFIHVLQHKNSSHLYACGSYAYTPRDAYLDTQTLALTPLSSAKGRCPFNPFERNTAITVDGELFTGTTDDFWGKKPFISRHLSRDGRPDVRQDTWTTLLDEPTFISSSFDKREGKLYFFFTEVLKEFHFRVDLKGARVAQICKDDVGGERILQKKWTTFAKSLLLCQTFDILQDMFALQPPEGNTSDEIVFYGIFTSQQSLSSEWSAVCRFKMEDIRSAFSGDYKTFDPQTHQWLTSARTDQGKCGLRNVSDVVLGVVKKSFLSNRIVQAAGAAPLISSGSDGVQYRRLVAVTTHAANQKEYTVLFLLTEKGFLHKTVLLDGGPRVLEEVQVFTEPQLVKSLLVSSSNGVVYVGWSGGVTAVPLAHCSSYKSCGQCVLAQDPFCSWDPTSLACTNHHTQNTIQDVENGNAKECPRSFTPHEDRHGQGPLPQHLFMQQLNGGLTFVVTADTLGDYTCTSQEAGYREVQANFSVIVAALEAHTRSIYTVHLDTSLDPLATG